MQKTRKEMLYLQANKTHPAMQQPKVTSLWSVAALGHAIPLLGSQICT